MAANGKLALKRRYERATSIAPFYTGGALAVSRDGTHLACKCGGDVKLLDAATGATIANVAADAEDITALALSPNGQELVTAGRDMMVKTWDVLTHKKVRSWKAGQGNSFVQKLCYDETGTLVAGGCSDAMVRVWDAGRGFATHSFGGHSALVTSLVFGPTPRADPNKLCLYSGAEDGEVRIWALDTKSCKAVLNGHDSAVTALELHSETKTLVTAGRDRVVIAWDLTTKKSVHTLPVYDHVEGMAIVQASAPGGDKEATPEETSVGKHKRGKRGAGAQDEQPAPRGGMLRGNLEVVTAGANGVLKRWKLGSGACVVSESERPGTVGYVALLSLPVGLGSGAGAAQSSLIAVTIENTLLFFDPASLAIQKQMVGYNDEILDVGFACTEPPILAVCTNSDHLRLFDTTSQSCRLLYGHTNVILGVDCHAKLGLVATASKDRIVRIWHVESGTCVAVGEGHVDAVGAVAIGQRSANVCCSGGNDMNIKVWNTSKLAQRAQKGLLASKGEDAGVLSVLRGWKAHDKDINSVTLSPNEAMIASASQDRTVKLWHVETGALTVTCKGHKRGVWCVKFSPVDKVVASSSADATIKLWAVNDGACLKTFEGHEGSVLKVVFISSGMQLLSSGSDGLLKLWTIKTNECVDSFDEHEDKMWALAAAPHDDSMVATGAADGLINIWADTTGQIEDQARQDSDERIALEQELSNAIRAKDVRKAALLALRLQHPARLLGIVRDVLMGDDAERMLRDVAGALNYEQLGQTLGYLKDWNTVGRNACAAQAMLQAILITWPPHQLEKVEGIQGIVDALLPYTQRHLTRLEQSLQRSYMIDFTLHAMQTYLGGDDAEDMQMLPFSLDGGEARGAAAAPDCNKHDIDGGVKGMGAMVESDLSAAEEAAAAGFAGDGFSDDSAPVSAENAEDEEDDEQQGEEGEGEGGKPAPKRRRKSGAPADTPMLHDEIEADDEVTDFQPDSPRQSSPPKKVKSSTKGAHTRDVAAASKSLKAKTRVKAKTPGKQGKKR